MAIDITTLCFNHVGFASLSRRKHTCVHDLFSLLIHTLQKPNPFFDPAPMLPWNYTDVWRPTLHLPFTLVHSVYWSFFFFPLFLFFPSSLTKAMFLNCFQGFEFGVCLSCCPAASWILPHSDSQLVLASVLLLHLLLCLQLLLLSFHVAAAARGFWERTNPSNHSRHFPQLSNRMSILCCTHIK